MTSRQIKWQLSKTKLGLCSICGKKKIFKNRRCRRCYSILRSAQKRWDRKHPDYISNWRKEHPNHMKKYRIRAKLRREEEKK